MRRLFCVSIVALALVVVAPRGARAEGGPFGLGLVIGSPTGIALKYYLGESGQAIDGAVGFGFVGASGFHVHADYLWHPWILTTDPSFTLPMHVGVGARVINHDRGRDAESHLHVGVRGPIGITFDFTEIPLDVFLELALIVDFHGDESDQGDEGSNVGLDLNAGVGVRYYF